MAINSPCLDVRAFDGGTNQVINERARRQAKLHREFLERPMGVAASNDFTKPLHRPVESAVGSGPSPSERVRPVSDGRHAAPNGRSMLRRNHR